MILTVNSERLNYYINKSVNMQIIIPDDILIRDGISCGDDILIQAAVNDDNILEFNFQCESCLQCKAIMGYIYNNYNRQPIILVIDKLKEDYSNVLNNFNNFCFKTFGLNNLRKSCIIKPIDICIKFFKKLSSFNYINFTNKDTKKDLDCDACVSTSRINWRNENILNVNNEQGEIKKDASDYPIEYRKTWMPLSKIYLNENEIKELKKISSSIDEADTKKFLKMKIDQMLFFNIKKYCGNDYKKIFWKSVWYRQYREIIVKNEINLIKEFIISKSLKAYFVKGAFMNQFYKNDIGIRTFLDYDIIAESSEIAFEIATYLFQRNFKIFYSEYSIKKIIEDNGNITYTGHFHLQKLIYGQYKIIIDINFPAFPMGRVSLYRPKRINNYKISLEDEFVITLCHLFKHKDVFIKDINDLYLLIKENLDLKYLENQIKVNKLELFFSVAVKYIMDNYDLLPSNIKDIQDVLKSLSTENIDIKNWPYNYKQVYKFKLEDFSIRTQKHQDNDRIYLFPLVIFNKILQITDEIKRILVNKYDNLKELDTSLYILNYRDNNYLICGMGIFWDNSNDINNVKRQDIEKFLNELVDIIDMRANLVYMTYYLEHYSKWFD